VQELVSTIYFILLTINTSNYSLQSLWDIAEVSTWTLQKKYLGKGVTRLIALVWVLDWSTKRVYKRNLAKKAHQKDFW
jgi:hypothetical protein